MTLRAVPAEDFSPWQVWPCRIGQGVDARKGTAPGPPGWGLGGGPITSLLKTKWITETLNTQRQPSLGANAVPWLNRQRMTPLIQNRGDACYTHKSVQITFYYYKAQTVLFYNSEHMDYFLDNSNPSIPCGSWARDVSVTCHVTHLTHFPTKIEGVLLILDNYLSEFSKATLSL